MPDLSHFWQRFLLASALIFGLVLGVAATVFGYSNTAPVNISWSVFRLAGIPLWTVAVVPLVLVLLAGTLYHWWNSFHHFTEHMRHRRRVHELEAELTSLRAHLDQLLEMPDQATAKPADKRTDQPAPPEITPLPGDITTRDALPEPMAANGGDKAAKKARKRVSLPVSETEPVAVAAPSDTVTEAESREETPADA